MQREQQCKTVAEVGTGMAYWKKETNEGQDSWSKRRGARAVWGKTLEVGGLLIQGFVTVILSKMGAYWRVLSKGMT
jgi:hypothetical protein